LNGSIVLEFRLKDRKRSKKLGFFSGGLQDTRQITTVIKNKEMSAGE